MNPEYYEKESSYEGFYTHRLLLDQQRSMSQLRIEIKETPNKIDRERLCFYLLKVTSSISDIEFVLRLREISSDLRNRALEKLEILRRRESASTSTIFKNLGYSD